MKPSHARPAAHDVRLLNRKSVVDGLAQACFAPGETLDFGQFLVREQNLQTLTHTLRL